MKLFFRKIGEGKPLIVLHGLFGLSDNWQTFAKTFVISNTTPPTTGSVYLVDLRNHGQSPHSSAFNYKEMADDVIELIRSENLDDATILGHSLGGKVAMTVALQNQQLVSKLIVVDIAPKYYPPHHTDVLMALNAVNLNEIKTRGEAEKILLGYISDMGTVQFLLKNLYWKNEKLAWRFNLESISANINNVGEEITSSIPFVKPTLFIRGEKSRYISNEDIPQIEKIFPNSKTQTILDAGHWVHADNLNGMLEVCRDFISEDD